MSLALTTTQRAVAGGVAAAALLIGAFTVGAGQGDAAQSASAGRSAPGALAAGAPRITVTGTGTVTGTPDTLLLLMGVQVTGASVSSALRQANQAVRSLTTALRGRGVRAADIQTSGLSVQPSYQSSSMVPDGYAVSESVDVTLRRLSIAGTQVSAAARAGGNAAVIDSVSLDLRDTSTLLASARAAAVADAKVKAAQYARALGRGLGSVVSMSEAAAAQPMPQYAEALPSAKSASVPVSPGTQQLSVSVTAVFALS